MNIINLLYYLFIIMYYFLNSNFACVDLMLILNLITFRKWEYCDWGRFEWMGDHERVGRNVSQSPRSIPEDGQRMFCVGVIWSLVQFDHNY